MSLMTTWTTAAVPHRPPLPEAPLSASGYEGLRRAWECGNCDLLNPGARRRCADCGTRPEPV